MNTLYAKRGKAASIRKTWKMRFLGFIILPCVILPILSMVLYDAKDVPWVQDPPNNPINNPLGPVGAYTAWVGYFLFGFASWLGPIWMAVYGFMLASSKAVGRLFKRLIWCLLSIASAASIVQFANSSLAEQCKSIELDSSGGIIGRFMMDEVLVRFVGPVGGIFIAAVLLLLSVAIFAGFGNIGIFFNWIGEKWSDARMRRLDQAEKDRIIAERERKAEEKAEREREREEARAEKERLREEARAEKERIREEKEREREERRREQEERDREEREREERRREEIIRAEEQRAAEERARAEAAAEEDDDEGGRLESDSIDMRPRDYEPEQPVQPAPRAPAPVSATPAAPEAPYELPSTRLLAPVPESTAVYGDTDEKQRILVETLREFRLEVEVTHVERGPVVTTFELLPASGIRPEQIAAMAKTIEMRLRATGIRIEAPIPGKGVVGVEIPNEKACAVTVREILEGPTWKEAEKKMFLPMLLGKDASGHDLVCDLASIPHLLIAGATGSGKSVCTNAILTGLLMSRTPDQLRLILVDPKVVEFSGYNAIPHLVVPIITDPKKVSLGLVWAIQEMEKRYQILAKAGVKNIASYNARAMQVQQDFFDNGAQPPPKQEKMPYIVIVIDELADLMLQVGREIDDSISRLAAKARAVGIHLILATQRPTVNVVTGTIKANIAGRIAFQVASQVDSKTILDGKGAESLIGHGDMLFLNPRASKVIRAQGAYIGDEDAEAVTKFIRAQAAPRYLQEVQDQLDAADNEEQQSQSRYRRGGGPSRPAPSSGGGSQRTPSAQGGAPLPADPGDQDFGGDDADADEILYQRALQVVRETHRASTSSIQRRLRIGYTRAARLVDLMEERGIVGPPRGSDPREILVDLDGEVPNNAATGFDDDSADDSIDEGN